LSILACAILAAAQETRDLSRAKADKPKVSDKRTALVIGNAAYEHKKLANPVNDATDMSAVLKELGFDVITGTDLSLKQMREKVREFGDKLKENGGVGLFYYAGHGIQVNGTNYLIPVDTDIPREDEIESLAYSLDNLFGKLATANNGFNIVILDACRDNPFAKSWNRSTAAGGLAQVNAPTGTFIGYATDVNRTASDGKGRNGVYTGELLKSIKKPYIKLEETFKDVVRNVKEATAARQVPWIASSVSGDFFFVPPQGNAVLYWRWAEMLKRKEFSAVKKETTAELGRDPESMIALMMRGRSDRFSFGDTLTVRQIKRKPADEYEFEVLCWASDFSDDDDYGIKHCDAALKINPLLDSAFLLRGRAFARKKQFDLAIADFSKAITIDPKLASAFHGRGEAYVERSLLDLAILDFSNVLAIDPNFPMALRSRGLAYQRKKELDSAIIDFTKAIESEPLIPYGYILRGKAFEEMERDNLALADFTKAIAISPKFAEAYNARGAFYLRRKQTDLAMADYSEAIKQDPRYAPAYRGRAKVFRLNGDEKSAKADDGLAEVFEKVKGRYDN